MGFRHAEVKALVGKESGVLAALDKVSRSDIRHWIECMEDRDVSYEEIKGAKAAAPPAMMMVWTMPPLWSAEPKEPSEPHEIALKALDDAGYEGAVGLKLDQEFFKAVQIGQEKIFHYFQVPIHVGQAFKTAQAGKGMVGLYF